MIAPETHVLVDIEPGALLLDLQSGQLFRLNQSAALVWRQHLSGAGADEIARVLAGRYRIPEARARGDLAAALQLSAPALPEAPWSEFHYQRVSGGGYAFSRAGQPVFLIDPLGQYLSRSPTADLGQQETRRLLSSVAPKLLSLRGQIVLHASAVAVDDRVMVFSGASGAGKTTTARAMVKAGAAPVCEDKLVVRLGSAGVDAVVDTESIVAAWVDAAADALSAGRPAACEALAAVTGDAVRPVSEVGFLSVDRRTAGPLSARPLAPADAAAAVFANSFYGSAEADDWKRQLVVSVEVARAVGAFDLTVPAGISGLVEAALQIVGRRTLRTGA